MQEIAINLVEESWTQNTFAKLIAIRDHAEDESTLRYANCRLIGQDHTLSVPMDEHATPRLIRECFEDLFEHRFGYRPESSQSLEIVSIRHVVTRTTDEVHTVATAH